jgi:hypothetical protein
MLFLDTVIQYDWQVCRFHCTKMNTKNIKMFISCWIICFYILMNMHMSAECTFCLLNLKIQGTFKSSVSLFNRTANKDLVSSMQWLNENSFVLCDLLSAIGIKVRQGNTLSKSFVSSSNEGSKLNKRLECQAFSSSQLAGRGYTLTG